MHLISTRYLTCLLAVLLCAGPLADAKAQLPPSVPRYTQTAPPASVPAVVTAAVMTADTAGGAAPPAQGVDMAYIWFGNDQTNEAVRLIRANRPVEALEIADRIVKLNMRLPEAHLLRGIAFLQLKDLARAEQAFGTVIAIDRGYLGAYVYLAQIALQRGNVRQVEVYLQAIRAVALTEDCAEYRYVRNSLRSATPSPTEPGR